MALDHNQHSGLVAMLFFRSSYHYNYISNRNWTEWSTIQGVIGLVISNRVRPILKLRARLLPELYDTKSNY